jgi:hypothetical protein
MTDPVWANDATIPGMVQHVFRAKLGEHSPEDPGSWHFLTLPVELSEDIALEGGPRKGFGSIPVEVSLEVAPPSPT